MVHYSASVNTFWGFNSVETSNPQQLRQAISKTLRCFPQNMLQMMQKFCDDVTVWCSLISDSLTHSGSSSNLMNALNFATNNILGDSGANRAQCPDFCFLLLGGAGATFYERTVRNFRRACDRFATFSSPPPPPLHATYVHPLLKFRCKAFMFKVLVYF